MKESLKEQLARLAKSGELNPSASGTTLPERKHTTNSVRGTPENHQRTATSYESTMLELTELREAKSALSAEIDILGENLAATHAEISNLNSQLSAADQSNKELVVKNRRLERELESLPTPESIQAWRERARQAEVLVDQANESIKQVEQDRKQLDIDRLAFEKDLERLDQLDTHAKQLEVDRRLLSSEEEQVRRRAVELQKAEKKLLLKKNSLEKLSKELRDLESNFGHLKGVERALKALETEYSKISKQYETSKTRVRNLTTERDQALKGQLAAESTAKRTSRELRGALAKLGAAPEGELIIRSLETVQWLISQFNDTAEQVVSKQVLLIGEGPWPIDIFTELLVDLGFEVWQDGCDADIEVVIVGRENWSEAVIDGQIEERDGESLRVYSQELFIALLAMQADPLTVADSDALLRFVEGHLAFEYLLNQEFPWPETTFEDEPPKTINEGFDGEDAASPLYKMGYSVAQQLDLSTSRRREILIETYGEDNLPWCISDEYMEDWGEANSRRRLRRIAWHLHLMTKRFRRHTEAVSRWRLDLDWLKQSYYKPVHRFRWPA